jgi:hypothetical protein
MEELRDVRSACTTKVTSDLLPTIPVLSVELGLAVYLHFPSSRFKDCTMSTKLALLISHRRRND